MFELKGMYCPIATPFIDGAIVYDKLDENLEFWTSSDLDGIVVMGSNGEFMSLTFEEKAALLSHCAGRIGDKKHVVAGTGSNCMDDTLALNRIAADCGAKAALLIPPHYYKGAMTDDVLENYFAAVADRSPLPIILYNMPANTGINLSSALQARLSHHENIIGVKDTSGNITQITETIRDCAPGFSVLAGNWAFLLPSLHMGALGGTLALANVVPNECAALLTLFRAGRMAEARDLALRLMPLNAAITAKYGVAGLKAALELTGRFGGQPRLPLVPVSAQRRAEIKDILEKAGIPVKACN